MQKPQAKLRLVSINVGTLVGSSAEVMEAVGKNIDAVAVQKMHFRNERVKALRGNFVYRF